MGKHKKSKLGVARELAEFAGIVGSVYYARKTRKRMEKEHEELMREIQGMGQAQPCCNQQTLWQTGQAAGIEGTQSVHQEGVASSWPPGVCCPVGEAACCWQQPQLAVMTSSYTVVEHHYHLPESHPGGYPACQQSFPLVEGPDEAKERVQPPYLVLDSNTNDPKNWCWDGVFCPPN